ncbi:MAG: hypothetical protein A3F09_03655 [Chlamydiae bacterium RIFCSPHIGHO2_12_FULL_49_11]|nr:MAG: hypothetical protein A3F09_03655 [Chlamydiae bacterium RIFCSPHIGHO2_12_FULL_49_11]
MTQPERNDPCPCGSGKKYKKCCGVKKGLTQRSIHILPSTPSPLSETITRSGQEMEELRKKKDREKES